MAAGESLRAVERLSGVDGKTVRRYVEALIIEDFALQALDASDTADVYELIVERHRSAATVVTSNREPVEWLGLMADPLLAQSAIDRLQSAAYELVIEASPTGAVRSPDSAPLSHYHRLRDHLVADAERMPNLVPRHWRRAGSVLLANVTLPVA